MTDQTTVDERRHFPRQRSGCYYERTADCCWLCLARFAVSAAQREGESA